MLNKMASIARNLTSITDVGFIGPPKPRISAAAANSSPERTTVETRGIVKYSADFHETIRFNRSLIASMTALVSLKIVGSIRNETDRGIVKQDGT